MRKETDSADEAKPTSPSQEVSNGALVDVFSAYSPVEAHIVSGMLEDNGITCYLGNEFIAAVESPISNLTGGVIVRVQQSDMAAAQALLKEAA